MALRLKHDRPEPSDAPGPAGLIVALPERPRDDWHWWQVENGALGEVRRYSPGGEAPWGDSAGLRVVALAPAALSPVREKPVGDMPMAQALAAARLDPPGLQAPIRESHVCTAPAPGADAVSSAAVARADMDTWLSEMAAAGLDPAAIVPAALALPVPAAGQVAARMFAGQMMARTPSAAFAADEELLPVLAPGAERVDLDDDDLARRLLAQFVSPELDLRQGIYAPPRVSFFRLPDWRQLARMAALLLLLICAIFVVETVKLNFDADAREETAIAAAQARFPAATDLAGAQAQIRAELLRRGAGGVSFADSAPAVFAAMQPNPSIQLRNINWRADGTLAIRAAAPTNEALNQMLIALQRDGWEITVPPEVAPDASGATVADITVRAP